MQYLCAYVRTRVCMRAFCAFRSGMGGMLREEGDSPGLDVPHAQFFVAAAADDKCIGLAPTF